MTQGILAPLNLCGELLLTAVAVAVIGAPILPSPAGTVRVNAQSGPTVPALAYDVVSIKPVKTSRMNSGFKESPDGLVLENQPLCTVIAGAYDVRMDRISGMPGWVTSDHYDLQAKMGEETAAAFHKLPEDEQKIERWRMLQAALEDRLKLRAHHETKLARTYALVIAKGGSKLKEANTSGNASKMPAGATMMSMGYGVAKVAGREVPMSRLADQLGTLVDGPVKDQTGLTGKYDFTLECTPDTSATASEDSTPSIFTALQEQLGLKLEPTKGPVDTLVIDHIERPSEN